MKLQGSLFVASVLGLLVLAPLVFDAQLVHAFNANSTLVPCGNVIGDQCTVCDTVQLAMNIISFFVFFSVVVAALLFVNAGILYIFSPANPGNIARAHKLFMSALVGLIIILASWLIIDFIMRALYSQGNWGPWNDILCTGGNSQPTLPVSAGYYAAEDALVVGAGPGYTPFDRVDPADPSSRLSDAALSSGLANTTNNCSVNGQSCTDYIIAQANAQGVDPTYALALAAVESGGCANPATCTSQAGAVGVIQLMPATAREMCGAYCANLSDSEMVVMLQDPQNNIDWGVAYMAQSSTYVQQQMAAYPERFDPARTNDYMAAYYNGGASALLPSADCGPTMTRYECPINPGGYVETQNYVDRMNSYVGSVTRADALQG